MQRKNEIYHTLYYPIQYCYMTEIVVLGPPFKLEVYVDSFYLFITVLFIIYLLQFLK